MSAASAAAHGRRAARRDMLDTGTALRLTGGTYYDEVAQVDREDTEPLFGPVRCKIQTRNVQARESEVGGRTAVEVRTELHLPADTAPLAVGDVWEITETHSLSLAVVGARYRVTAPVDGTLKTARRYQVEQEVS